MAPKNLAITLTDTGLRHMNRVPKQERGQAIPKADLLKLSEYIEKPQAVLFDKTDPALLYVFDAEERAASGKDKRLGKFVVRVNYTIKQKHRATETTNSVCTAGMVSVSNLNGNTRYELIDGEL